ncbi:unnamed protein product [Pocillopora meandrina]|uniref:Uncharacterized protein n=1 Tax=Pocillopora meandrina TaxID=46732 RepID=A0AAU9Y338_9CNID|nr:unnamed protein product [Pocillopora meandrina]
MCKLEMECHCLVHLWENTVELQFPKTFVQVTVIVICGFTSTLPRIMRVENHTEDSKPPSRPYQVQVVEFVVARLMHRQHDYLFNATWKRSLASDNSACLTFVSLFSLESRAWMTAIIVTVIVFVALIFLSVCLAERIKRRNREVAERFPMAIVSRRIPSEPVDTTIPQVSRAPVSTNADIPPQITHTH